MNAQIKQKIETFYAQWKSDVDGLANYLGVPPLWLVCLFYNESGLNPQAENSIHAVGLNQMLPATLAGLNSSVSAYKNGGVPYQLTVMREYFKPIKGKVKRAGDLYLFNFLPAAVIENVSKDFVLGQKDNYEKYHGISKHKVYEQNKGLDYSKDGKITRGDFWDGFEMKYDDLVKPADNTGGFFFRDLAIDFKTNWVAWVIAAVLAFVVLFIVLNKLL